MKCLAIELAACVRTCHVLHVHRTVLPSVTTATCTSPLGVVGRYVSIQYVAGATAQLTLCEVHVGGPGDLACGQTCAASG